MNIPVSHSIEEVSTITGICKTKIYAAINEGHLKARKLGKRTLILQLDLIDFLNGLEQYVPTAPKKPGGKA